GATLFTSGFAETGTEEGIALQAQIAEMAKRANFNLIGPNCMGIFNPRVGLRHALDQYAGEGGPVGFISQSGTQNAFFSLLGMVNGVKVSKSVSYGNAIVLDSPDYLEYLAQDEDTRVIGMYIEGARDGRRLLRTLRDVTQKKPVLIWKGGQTEEGARATSSHTGSLMESMTVWDAIMKQCGIIGVDTMEEMVDSIKALLYMKPGQGDRVGLVAMTGGQSVAITDAFARNGLRVPLLTQASYDKLGAFFATVGASYRNPLDAGSTFSASFDNLVKMLDIMKDDENVDVVVLEISVALFYRRWRRHDDFYSRLVQALVAFKARCDKPFLTTLSPIHMEAKTLELKQALTDRGILSFTTFDSAARALRKVIDYYRFHGLGVGHDAGFGVLF
ncbi:MAG: hypothetical protein ABIH46_09210, partial [Chloroflexota bacterium]